MNKKKEKTHYVTETANICSRTVQCGVVYFDHKMESTFRRRDANVFYFCCFVRIIDVYTRLVFRKKFIYTFLIWLVWTDLRDIQYCFFFFYFIPVGLLRANVILPRSFDCECLNTAEPSHEECINNVAHCSNTDSDKPSSCFVLWATDNSTGNDNVFRHFLRPYVTNKIQYFDDKFICYTYRRL